MNNSTWWRSPDDLDPTQKKFLNQEIEGQHLLIGPPGCGKTNLLLLRAKRLYLGGKYNVLFLTYTKDLASFIQSGLRTQTTDLPCDQVKTVWSWARSHIQEFHPTKTSEFTNIFQMKNERDKYVSLVELVKMASNKAATTKLYDAIFLDEAQDLPNNLIQELARLTDKLCLGGDNRQSIFEQDGIVESTFTTFKLRSHYRMGKKICRIADGLLPPASGDPTLCETSQYDEGNESSTAIMLECSSLEDQFSQASTRITNLIRAYPGELIGVVFPKNNNRKTFQEWVSDTELAEDLTFHDGSDDDSRFDSGKPAHVLNVHRAKGAEFKALVIICAEDFSFPLHRREIVYTAVTRAKTSLTVFYSGKVNAPILSAFAESKKVSLEELF